MELFISNAVKRGEIGDMPIEFYWSIASALNMRLRDGINRVAV